MIDKIFLDPQLMQIIALIVFILRWVIFGGFLLFFMLRARSKGGKIPFYFLGIFLVEIFRLRVFIIENQIFTTIIAYLILYLVIVSRRLSYKQYFIQWDGLDKSLFWGCIAGVCMSVVFFLLGIFHLIPNEEYASITVFSSIYLIWNVLAEELIFRSLILGELIIQGFSTRQANIIQSGLFSVSHLYNYFLPGYWIMFGIAFVVGLAGGCITKKTKNLAGSVIIHTLINFTSILLTHF